MVDVGGCSGAMIGPRAILTSAHCFASGTTSTSLTIEYFDPATAADDPREIYSGPLEIHLHNEYDASASPRFTRANHDLALVTIPSGAGHWQETGYEDYLRLYTGDIDSLTELRQYGRGPNTQSGEGSGVLRTATFPIDTLTSERIELNSTADERVCKGDSGGAYLLPSQDFIACVHSRSDKSEGDKCAENDPGSTDAVCSRPTPTSMEDLLLSANLECVQYEDYQRCFDLPFINSVENEGLEQGLATAIYVSFS